MFDELKKKLFGSSKLPEIFPNPVKLTLDESAEKFAHRETEPIAITITKDMEFGDYSKRLLEQRAVRDELKHTLGAALCQPGVNSKILAGLSKMTTGGPTSRSSESRILERIGERPIGAIASTAEEVRSGEEVKRLKESVEQKARKALAKSLVAETGNAMSAVLARAKEHGDHSEVASGILKKLMIAASETGLNIHELLEEMEMTDEEKTKEALALEALAKSITEYWGGVDYELSEDRFSLHGAASLTILRAPSETHKSGYGKKAHIGGEEFTGVKAYLGKRGQIICCFKPCGIEDYTQMEMPLGEAFSTLSGFQRHFVESGFSSQYQAILDAKNEEKKAADLEKFGSHYSDFGSF